MNKKLPNKYNFLLPYRTKDLVRLGDKSDGGYVIDNSVLKDCKYLISFGMGENYSFEEDFLKINNNNIYVYDYSVSHIYYQSNIFKALRRILTFRRRTHKLFNLIKYYKNFRTFINKEKVNFFPLKVVKKKFNNNEIDLDLIFKDKKFKDILLKIDIEGMEYNLIDKLIKYSKKINLLVVEFHSINKKKKFFIKAIKKLKNKYKIIHLHGNNAAPHGYKTILNDGFPVTLEITFVNKFQKINYAKQNKKFPIKKIDYPNDLHKKDIKFSFN